jgi:hypothetical protein
LWICRSHLSQCGDRLGLAAAVASGGNRHAAKYDRLSRYRTAPDPHLLSAAVDTATCRLWPEVAKQPIGEATIEGIGLAISSRDIQRSTSRRRRIQR